MEDIFEKATRIPLRFDTVKGRLGVEDLWHLPLRSDTNRANLNDVAKAINKRIKESVEEDFVGTANNVLESSDPLALEVVKRVIAVRESENKARDEAQSRSEKKQTLLALLEKKKTEQLGGMTMEQLQEEIAKL